MVGERPSSATLAQLVERNLAKVEVTSSNLVCRSNLRILMLSVFSNTRGDSTMLRSRLSLQDREPRVSLQFSYHRTYR